MCRDPSLNAPVSKSTSTSFVPHVSLEHCETRRGKSGGDKVVRFSEECDEHIVDMKSISCCLENSDSETWWKWSEYKEIRLMTKIICSEVERRGTGDFLEAAFLSPHDHMHHLEQWCRFGFNRRGLEKLCCSGHGRNVENDREEVVRVVLEGQTNMSPEELATACEDKSRLSRQFAEAMGAADEVAIYESSSFTCSLAPLIRSAPRSKRPGKKAKRNSDRRHLYKEESQIATKDEKKSSERQALKFPAYLSWISSRSLSERLIYEKESIAKMSKAA